ncbi:SixA phosphatase family protein [Rhodopila sp.]|uniref:SixA phosphatase family protein n=1 Tax=Rhodopila sp. TaxID=2480087 RepID=UPI002B57FA1D|nr:histidine phosphatase family protein [Rhodopila sp.]HVZ08091.1 histidine phosphatase family protein [Rhodopila sp.]
MRQLLLLRHAKSSWDDKSCPDRDRPLNNRGRRNVARMAREMHALGLEPDVILVSPARRTMETMEALEPWADSPLIEPTESLYLADVPDLLGALHGVAETVRSVLLIGHNPGLHDLAISLAGLTDRPLPASVSKAGRALVEAFPTCSLAEFTIAGSWWELREGGGKLVRYLTPRLLEQVD